MTEHKTGSDKQRRIILVDMDDTLVDDTRGFEAWLHQHNLTGENRALKRQQVNATIGWYANLDPVPDSVEAMLTMEQEFDVWIVTMTPLADCGMSEKRKWVRRVLGAHFVAKIIFCTDKTMVRGDILIDDKVQQGAHAPTWKQIMFRQPHNTAYQGPSLENWKVWRSAISTLLPDS